MNKSKKAAMEMSIGTIVTIVLGVTLLIGGIFFIQKILSSAKGVVDLTDEQLRNEVNKLFSEENKISIYPGTRFIEIKQESTDGVGIGIRNLLTGEAGTETFSYEVVASDVSDCGISEEAVEDWIVTGQKEENIPIASGDFITDKILFRIPVGAPLCVAKFRVNVNAGGTAYATDSFNIEIKAK
jgi:hypothetical protein